MSRKVAKSRSDRLRLEKRKQAVYDLLGRCCVRCHFTDPRALQIDHINGGGADDRRVKSTCIHYKHILEDPDALQKYQILCANCNWIKRSENNEHIKRVS